MEKFIFDESAVAKYRNVSIDLIWKQMGDVKALDDTQVFPNLCKLAQLILLLPHSNAAAERIFSIVTDVKFEDVPVREFVRSLFLTKTGKDIKLNVTSSAESLEYSGFDPRKVLESFYNKGRAITDARTFKIHKIEGDDTSPVLSTVTPDRPPRSSTTKITSPTNENRIIRLKSPSRRQQEIEVADIVPEASTSSTTSTALPTPSGSSGIIGSGSTMCWDGFMKQASTTQSTEQSQNKPKPKRIRLTETSHLNAAKDADIVFTSESYAKRISLQMGRYFYATNTPFNHADHAEFRQLCNIMRPGYKPPSRRQIGGQILDDTYQSVLEECKQKLEGQVVSMSLDGWSNIHNEPIVCCSIMTQSGDSYLVSTLDTSGHPHTAEYLKEVATDAIQKTEETFGVKVRSFITDNTGNVLKMRKELIKDVDIIHYGCSAHILNLLAEDLDIPGVTEHILKAIKYFRNKHLPAAFYKEMRGKN
ncbi:unnamed protein product [Phaedon cochleariae]|uniref:DUF659 domain-containing protein n=1 Tax=Phaedon cochleariae TaxID=80249 RepID=A0A9N9X0Z1_PHACE|nr:unnamed protein product [Phaedon cochleariae]